MLHAEPPMINPKNQSRRLPERKPPWPKKLPTASGAPRRTPSNTRFCNASSKRPTSRSVASWPFTQSPIARGPLGASLIRHQVVSPPPKPPPGFSLQGVKREPHLPHDLTRCHPPRPGGRCSNPRRGEDADLLNDPPRPKSLRGAGNNLIQEKFRLFFISFILNDLWENHPNLLLLTID